MPRLQEKMNLPKKSIKHRAIVIEKTKLTLTPFPQLLRICHKTIHHSKEIVVKMPMATLFKHTLPKRQYPNTMITYLLTHSAVCYYL